MCEKGISGKGLCGCIASDDRDGGRDNDRVYLLRYGGRKGFFLRSWSRRRKNLSVFSGRCRRRFTRWRQSGQAESLDDFTRSGMRQMVDYMYAHFEEFQLLVTGAYGTKFQNFVEPSGGYRDRVHL